MHYSLSWIVVSTVAGTHSLGSCGRIGPLELHHIDEVGRDSWPKVLGLPRLCNITVYECASTDVHALGQIRMFADQ